MKVMYYTHYEKLISGAKTKHSFASSPQATGALIDDHEAYRLIKLWNDMSPSHVTYVVREMQREEPIVLSLIPARYLIY